MATSFANEIISTLLAAEKKPPQWPLIEELLKNVQDILDQEPVVVELSSPVKIVGISNGTHFNSLKMIFTELGFPSRTNSYLILGNFTNKNHSLRKALLLFALKAKYPKNVILLRGRNECNAIARIYGFYQEVKQTYHVKAWNMFCAIFDCLPLVAILDKDTFCVSGGCGHASNISFLKELQQLKKPIIVSDEGLVTDLLWSRLDATVQGCHESDRGIGYTYGVDTLESFLSQNHFKLQIASPELLECGIEVHMSQKLAPVHPISISIHSSCNHCEEFDNLGCVLDMKGSGVEQIVPYFYTPRRFFFRHTFRNLTLLLLARKFAKDSPLFQEVFPFDLFRLVVKMCSLSFFEPEQARSSAEFINKVLSTDFFTPTNKN